MKDGVKYHLDGLEKGGPKARYLDACNDYLRRQLLIYQHWPQRKYSVTGYTSEKVFTDQNA